MLFLGPCLEFSSVWYRSVPLQKHRVRLPTEEKCCKERTSVVFACFPDKNTILETLDGSGKYPPITAGEQLEINIRSKIYK